MEFPVAPHQPYPTIRPYEAGNGAQPTIVVGYPVAAPVRQFGPSGMQVQTPAGRAGTVPPNGMRPPRYPEAPGPRVALPPNVHHPYARPYATNHRPTVIISSDGDKGSGHGESSCCVSEQKDLECSESDSKFSSCDVGSGSDPDSSTCLLGSGDSDCAS